MGQASPTASYPTGSANTCGWGKKGVTGVREIKLSTDTTIVAGPNVITFDQDIRSADYGTNDLCVESNITQLWISPKKYWLNLRWPARQTARTYQNLCIVQNVGVGGAGNLTPDAPAMTGAICP